MTGQNEFPGRLYLEHSTLFFEPNIYPSTVVKKDSFQWDKKRRSWSVPVSASGINAILSRWPDVQVEPSVTEWLNNLDVLHTPQTIAEHKEAFEFQKEGSAFLLKHKRAILAFAPGLGKTITSILAANTLEGMILVIAPYTLLDNWKREIKRWTGDEAVIWHGKKEKWGNPPGRWVVTNYDTVVRQFVTQDNELAIRASLFQTIIIDESVMIKNRKAKRTRVMEVVTRDAEYVWLLSGSPTTKFLDDLWAQLHVIRPRLFRSYWKFAERYCEIMANQWGTIIAGNQYGAFERLQEDLKDCFIARTQDQVLDLPDWIIEDYRVPMEGAQLKSYLQMQELFFAELPEGDVVLAPNTLAQLTRLIQLASNPSIIAGEKDGGCKWEAIDELLGFVQFPVIIWTTYKRTAEMMGKRLEAKKHRVGILTGDTKQENRQLTVDMFQSGDLDVIVAHPGVGKFGLTLTRARTAIYLERSFNGDDYYQSLHRVRRIGTEHSPHVIHLIATLPSGEPTVDEAINRVLNSRKNSSLRLTTGLIREAWRQNGTD